MRPIAFSQWSTEKRWPGMSALTAMRRASTLTDMTPIARNGTDHWWNLQRTCQRCNHRKGIMTHEEFLASGRLRRQ